MVDLPLGDRLVKNLIKSLLALIHTLIGSPKHRLEGGIGPVLTQYCDSLIVRHTPLEKGT